MIAELKDMMINSGTLNKNVTAKAKNQIAIPKTQALNTRFKLLILLIIRSKIPPIKPQKKKTAKDANISSGRLLNTLP